MLIGGMLLRNGMSVCLRTVSHTRLKRSELGSFGRANGLCDAVSLAVQAIWMCTFHASRIDAYPSTMGLSRFSFVGDFWGVK